MAIALHQRKDDERDPEGECEGSNNDFIDEMCSVSEVFEEVSSDADDDC